MDIRKAIKVMHVTKGLTQRELAALLELSEANFSKILSKKDLRIHADIERIANALNYDVKLIFTDRDTGKEIETD